MGGDVNHRVDADDMDGKEAFAPCPECRVKFGCKKASDCSFPEQCRCRGPVCGRCRERIQASVKAAWSRCPRLHQRSLRL